MREITELIETQNKVNVKELASIFNVSEKTIRLDLNKLEKTGVLFRTHGGAIKRSFVLDDQLFGGVKKYEQHIKQKQEIAQKALSLIKENYTICLDSGSTTFEIAKLLGDFPVSVITHDLNIITELARKENVELLIVGGLLSKNDMIIFSEESAKFIHKQTANIAFIGTSFVSCNNGYTLFKRADKEIKKAYMQISDNVYCVVDSSKFEQKALTRLARVSEMPNLITDSCLDDELKALYTQNNFNII